MEITLGKLKNRDTGEELPFAINPVDYRLSRSLHYVVEPCLGQSAPVVAFQSGGAAELSFYLVYDEDVDPKCDVKKAGTFVHGLGKVQTATKSTPIVEFTMGAFQFSGYLRQSLFQPGRFDAQGNPTNARIDLTIVSNGEYEDGKA